MTAIATLVILALIIVPVLVSLGRLAIRETRRGPQQTSLQHRFFNDNRERANWQMFTCALSAGTLPQLQENLK